MADHVYIRRPVDASSIQGVPVSEARPTDGQALVYDAASDSYVPSLVSGSGGGGSGGSGGDPNASYLVIAATGSLSNERVFTPGTGLSTVNTGPGGTYTVSVNNNVVATISGSSFTGHVSAPAFSGSLTRLSSGLPYLITHGSITATTNSLGQVVLSGSGGGDGGDDLSGYAQLAGATFSGPLTASLGVSASFATCGANPAQVGALRFPNATDAIYFRNAAGTQNLAGMSLSSANFLNIGTNNGGTSTTYPTQTTINASSQVNLYVAGIARAAVSTTLFNLNVPTAMTSLTASLGIAAAGRSFFGDGSTANGGTINLPNGSNVKARNAANSADLCVFDVNSSNNLSIGVTNANTEHVNNVNLFGSNMVSMGLGSSTKFSFSTTVTNLGNPTLRFFSFVVSPVITQDNETTASTHADSLTVRAQTATGASSNGGDLVLASGAGTLRSGSLKLAVGAVDVLTIDSTWMVRSGGLRSRIHDGLAEASTSGAGTVAGLSFLSGANGRTYAVDAMLTSQHASTIETARWKLSGHFRQASGNMVLVAMDPPTSSSLTPALSGTLSLSGGGIVLQVTTPSGSWNHTFAMRVQETG